MNTSQNIKNITAALLKFDIAVSKIAKGETNPFFKNKYAALPNILDAIKQPLIDAGLTVKQFPEGEHMLTTIVFHAESGEYIESTYTMKPVKENPQEEGSRITYQRRYALGSVLGLNIDVDDDGNGASKPQEPNKPPVKTELPKPGEKRNLTPEILAKIIERAKAGEEGVFEKMIINYHVSDDQINQFKKAM